MAEQIQTAAITYDPAFDLPDRMRAYGLSRGLQFDEHHRMLRPTHDAGLLRSHFELGVNFVGSLVNRHRVEAYIMDAETRIAASFERTQLDEQQLVESAVKLLNEQRATEQRACDSQRTDATELPVVALARNG